jgi:transcriptional regulator with XRE-family HTH domain
MRARAFRGERLRQAREFHGLSQVELGQRIGTGPNQITRYELGTADPSPYHVKRIAEELRVTTDYLLGLVDRPGEYMEHADPITPDERRFLEALRNGKLRPLLQMLEKAMPNETTTDVDVPADETFYGRR